MTPIILVAMFACSFKTHLCISVVDQEHPFKTLKACEPARKKTLVETKKLLSQVPMPGPWTSIVVCQDKETIDKVLTYLDTQKDGSEQREKDQQQKEFVAPKSEAPDGSY